MGQPWNQDSFLRKKVDVQLVVSFFFLNPKFPYKNLLFPGEKRNLLLLQKKKLEMGKQRAISERRVRRQTTLNIFLLC